MPMEIPKPSANDVQVLYVNRTNFLGGDANHKYDNSVFEPIYGSALLTGTTFAENWVDGWSNAKVPVLSNRSSDFESAAGYSPGWISNSSWTTFTSLIGLPISYTEAGTVSSILVNTSYFMFDCDDPNLSTPAVFNTTTSNGTAKFSSDFGTASRTLWLSYTNNSTLGANGPASGTMEWASVGYYKDLEHLDCNETTTGSVNCTREYYPDPDTSFVYSSCRVKSVGIQINLACSDSFSCSIDTARIIPDAPFAHLPLSTDMVKHFLQTQSGSAGVSTTTISEAYMAGAASVLQYLTGQYKTGDDIAALDAPSFTSNMQTMWNTFYALYYGNEAYTEGISANAANASESIAATTGKFTTDEKVYSLAPGWTALYFFSCVVLMVLAILDIVWEAKTISPDFLGFASSVVRNNQRLNKHLKDSNLSGVQKTRAMGNMEVMIQDVNSTANVGKIALAPSVASSVRLRKTRQYGT